MLARVIVSCCLLWLSSVVQAQTVIRAVVDEWAPFGGEALPNRGISLDVMTTVLTERLCLGVALSCRHLSNTS